VRQRQAKLLREVQVVAQLREGTLADGGIACGEDLAHLMREAISMQSESASAAGHQIAIRGHADAISRQQAQSCAIRRQQRTSETTSAEPSTSPVPDLRGSSTGGAIVRASAMPLASSSGRVASSTLTAISSASGVLRYRLGCTWRVLGGECASAVGAVLGAWGAWGSLP